MIGWRHIPYHVDSLKNALGIECDYGDSDERAMAAGDNEEINGYNTALDADKIFYKHNEVICAFDTAMSTLPRIKQMQIIKTSRFDTLVKAKNYPTLVKARMALIDADPYVTDFWINDNLRFKLGTCYETNFEPSTNEVSCMLLYYESKSQEEYTSGALQML